MYNRLKRLSWMVNHILEKMLLELAVEGWAELGSREEHGQGEGREMVVIKMVRMEVGRNNKMLTPLLPPIANVH